MLQLKGDVTYKIEYSAQIDINYESLTCKRFYIWDQSSKEPVEVIKFIFNFMIKHRSTKIPCYNYPFLLPSVHNKKGVISILIQKYHNNYLVNSMNSQSIFILTALVFSFLVFSARGLSTILTPTTTYAQETDDSETSTEQDIGQKNV
jgi:hypothetical protein